MYVCVCAPMPTISAVKKLLRNLLSCLTCHYIGMINGCAYDTTQPISLAHSYRERERDGSTMEIGK